MMRHRAPKLSELSNSTPNYPERYRKYFLAEAIRPLVEVHCGV